MKAYPSISPEINYNETIYAFDKLDGSNVRVEWSSKRGFYKYGSRKRLISPSENFFGLAYKLVPEKYASLEEIAKSKKWRQAVFFFEMFGPNSFAGNHSENDDIDIVLIDAAVDNRGILPPKEFLKTFQYVPHADMLYHGKANKTFQDEVRNGALVGMTFEGVVCKGRIIKPGLPLMFKVKNQAWRDKLKNKFKDDPSKIQELM